MKRSCFVLSILFALISFASSAQTTGTKNLVNIIPAPAGSLVPDVVMDSSGVLHMVYYKNQNVYYIRSTDNGASFTSPVQVNSTGIVEYNMGERGPKLAVGSDGVIHVVWMDKWYSGAQVHARYSRSTNGGLSFEPRQQVSNSYGVDGVTVTADGIGHVLVFWHINVPSQSTIPQATWLHMNRSNNNGLSFNPASDTNVVIGNLSPLACSMCMIRARCGADGKAYLVFRSADANIRDFYVIKAAFTSNNFTAVRVNYDNWNINYCPMVGPELEIGNGGRQFCAFMSDGHVYWAVSDSNVTAFTQHVATPLNEVDELFPTAVENIAGQVLFLWQVGPMSVNDSAWVKYAVYNSNGTYTGIHDTVAKTFSGTRATAYVGTDDNFYIVVNANIITTSIQEEQDNPNISVFPNPASDLLYITGIKAKTKINLYDSNGKLVLQKASDNNTSMDISRLPQGIYTISLETGKSSVSEKVQISR